MKNSFLEYIAHARQYRLPLIFSFYLVSIPFSYLCAFYVRYFRYDLVMPDKYWPVILETLPLLILARLLSYTLSHSYSASWQFSSLHDLVEVIRTGVLGSVLFLLLVFSFGKIDDYLPLSIIPLEGVISIVFISGGRFFFKYCCEGFLRSTPHKIKKRILIVGAGHAGIMTLQAVTANPGLGVNPVGFIDDNVYLKGTKRKGLSILGTTKDLPHLLSKYTIDEVVLAIPSAAHKDIVRIKEFCTLMGMPVRIIPSVGKFIQDETYTGHIKEVLTDDLLGRNVIRFSQNSDRARMDKEIKGMCVLVTGAGGSIGSELCRQAALYHPRLLILYERHETSLSDIEIDIRKIFPEQQILCILGDILDTKKMDILLKTYTVDIIYHAAAYKHVPVMEREPLEAVRNNIFGTYRLGELAIKHGVKKFMMISTDKAVKPSSIMGATKRVAEMIVQQLNSKSCWFIAVRFGNVIGSSGSVIPLFKKQIAQGGPVTVTHPEMTRYFMAISEAVQLLLMAGTIGNGGEIFLLDMGQPIKILDVAEALIQRSGLIPNKDIDIIFSGIRPGEKLHEELFWAGDGIVSTENKSITMLKPDKRDYSEWLNSVNMLELDLESSNAENVVRQLHRLVNDFTAPEKSSVHNVGY